MGTRGRAVCDLTDARGKPLPWAADIAAYSHAVVATLRPVCMVLHGSVARGDYTQASDVDIVVIGGNLADAFLDRLGQLIDLNATHARIEALGYTQAEFEQMLAECHLTALEAMEFGMALYGKRYFARLRRIFANMKARGLRRTHTSWHIALS